MEGVPEHILEWAAVRDRYRRDGAYEAADALREKIAGAGWEVHDTPDGGVVTPAKPYRTVAPADVPDHTGDDDAHDYSVLLLLDTYGIDGEPPWVVEDATRCLASVLTSGAGAEYEVVILDNGVGGDAGRWAADAARNPGITAIHLAEPVGFATARRLQHQVATGRFVVWLDTGVELTRPLGPALDAAFSSADVGLVGRWGADVGSVQEFAGVQAPDTGVREVSAVWGYCLALRRGLLRGGDVALDEGYAFYRNADADLSMAVRAAGSAVVLAPLPATQHVHRGYAETPAEIVERESSRNYRRLLDRWRPEIERLAAR